MEASAILTCFVLFQSCLLFGTPVLGSNDPYIFLLDVGNAGLQKTTLQQTLLSVTGGSMSYRYPASGNGGMITHTNVVGKDYGSDLTAVITGGGPGYQFIEITVIGQDDIPYQLLVTIEGQTNNGGFSVSDSTSLIPDDSESYGSVPSGSAVYEKVSYRDDVDLTDGNVNTEEISEMQNAEDGIRQQIDRDLDNDYQNTDNEDNEDDAILPSSEIGDEMYPDEPRFKNVDQYADSYDSNVADIDDDKQYSSPDNTPTIEDNEVGLGNVDSSALEYADDGVDEKNDAGVESDNDRNSVDSGIEENNYTGDENGNGDDNLSNDIDVNSNIPQSDGNNIVSSGGGLSSHPISNDPYKFWDMKNVDPTVNEIDSEPQDASYKMEKNSDFPVREKKAPEEYSGNEDELPDPALYQRYEVLKPHLYGDVQLGPHGERQDLNVNPHWTNDMKSDSLADEQIDQSHNEADKSREYDDGSYDNNDVSAALY